MSGAPAVSRHGRDRRDGDSEPELIVFRPSIRFLLRSLTGGATFIFAMLALVAVQLYRTRSNLAAGKLTSEVLVGVLLVAVGWNALNLWMPRLVVKADQIQYRDRFGRRRRYVRQAIRGVALRGIRWGGIARRSVFLIVYDTEYKTLFSMSGSYWGVPTLTEVSNRLGDRRERHPVETTPAKLAKEFPGSLSFLQLHPLVVVLMAALIFLVVMLSHF